MKTNEKNYVRDKRSPIPSSAKVSEIMSKNKAKDTKPEILLRKELWHSGLRGYRLHPKNVPGKPDICYISKKVAIFVNGCFWHRCPHCKLTVPKSNSVFWVDKFNKNIERDQRKILELKELGWETVTTWECQIKTQIKEQVINIKSNLVRSVI